MTVVQFENIHRAYTRGHDVLDGVSFSIGSGEVVGLLGKNGAGKTTLLHIAMGMIEVQQGSTRIFGLDPRRDALEIKRRVGYVSEEQILPGFLTVEKTIAFHRSLFSSWDDSAAAEMLDHFRLAPSAKIRTLSKGQARQVALICAVAHKPELLILDEPAGGLDPAARREFLETSIEPSQRGGLDDPVLVAPHDRCRADGRPGSADRRGADCCSTANWTGCARATASRSSPMDRTSPANGCSVSRAASGFENARRRSTRSSVSTRRRARLSSNAISGLRKPLHDRAARGDVHRAGGRWIVTLALIRRDPSFRGLLKWVLIAPMSCSVLMGVIGLLVYRSGPGFLQHDLYRTIWLLAVVWLPMGLFLFLGKTGVRCGNFDMVLPVDARRLWLTHTMAVFVSGCAIALASIGIVALHDRLRQRLTDGTFPNLGASGLIVPTIAGLALAVIILQSRDPALRTIRRSPAALWSTAAVFLGVFVVMVVLESVSVFWAVVPAIVAFVVGARFLRTVPAAFTIVPREPEDIEDHRGIGTAEVGDDGWAAVLRKREHRGAAARWRVNLTVLNVLSRGIAPGALIKVSLVPLVGAPILLLWGVFASGPFSRAPSASWTSRFSRRTCCSRSSASDGAVVLPVHGSDLSTTTVRDDRAARTRAAGSRLRRRKDVEATGAPNAGIVYQTEPSDWVFPPYPSEAPMVRVRSSTARSRGTARCPRSGRRGEKRTRRSVSTSARWKRRGSTRTLELPREAPSSSSHGRSAGPWRRCTESPFRRTRSGAAISPPTSTVGSSFRRAAG